MSRRTLERAERKRELVAKRPTENGTLLIGVLTFFATDNGWFGLEPGDAPQFAILLGLVPWLLTKATDWLAKR